ncbi:MAG: poly-gamma-glutamate biosynthesis protein PgsC [Candidatus Marinimicrobia bacterium]|nr:poly-gamma-glutamate biosynthesis protein PgsC [Candidatus Neomarinimicrobiota bacterium]
MIEITVGLGIALSLLLSEFLGVTAGGIIVPGYIALYLHQPLQVVVTFLVAILVYGIIKFFSRYMFIYGKRRIVLAIILGFLFGYISRNFLFSPYDAVSFAVIGNIIPGLIANWMDRQGMLKTIAVVLVTAILVKLMVLIISGGQIFEAI